MTPLRPDPKYRYARVWKDDQGTWQIEPCYDYLPLGAFITYEYRIDDYLPVVWETLPTTRDEQEQVAIQACNAFLYARVTTPAYFATPHGEVYLLTEAGYERLICAVTGYGDAEEIAYALNQTFPNGDTRSYHDDNHDAREQRHVRARQRTTTRHE